MHVNSSILSKESFSFLLYSTVLSVLSQLLTVPKALYHSRPICTKNMLTNMIPKFFRCFEVDKKVVRNFTRTLLRVYVSLIRERKSVQENFIKNAKGGRKCLGRGRYRWKVNVKNRKIVLGLIVGTCGSSACLLWFLVSAVMDVRASYMTRHC
jgi:hypothetical protein